MRFEEGLTSFNRGNSANFSGGKKRQKKKKTVKEEFSGVYFLKIREKIQVKSRHRSRSLERFSYDFEMKRTNKRNNKLTEIAI